MFQNLNLQQSENSRTMTYFGAVRERCTPNDWDDWEAAVNLITSLSALLSASTKSLLRFLTIGLFGIPVNGYCVDSSGWV